MGKFTITSYSAAETEQLGEMLGSYLQPGDCLPLTGDMGTGKTCFVKGVAKGLGVPQETVVNSPTFTLINYYHGNFPLYHIDLYRLTSESELDDLEISEILHSDGITLIEWPEFALSRIQRITLHIHFVWEMVSEHTRTLTFSGDLTRFERFFQEIYDQYTRD